MKRYSGITDLLTDLRQEDTTYYLKLISRINKEKLDTQAVRALLSSLSFDDISNLSNAQNVLIRQMGFTRGAAVHFYNSCPISIKLEAVQARNWSFLII